MFYGILRGGKAYDPARLLRDIHRPEPQAAGVPQGRSRGKNVPLFPLPRRPSPITPHPARVPGKQRFIR